MAKVQIGAQLYTVREKMQTPEEIYKGFQRIHQDGFKVAQVSGLGPIEAERLRDIAQEFGVEICITHSPYDRMKNDLDNLIKEHKTFGCSIIGLGSMPGDFRKSREGYVQFIKEANEIAKRMEDQGMHLSYHNHKFEFEKYDGVRGIDMLFEQIPDMLFTLDTYWVQAGGCNPVDYVKKMAGRVQVLHLKDMCIVDNEQRFSEIGEGNIDFIPVYKAAEETGVKWAVIEQDNCYGKDPFDSLKLSFDNINRDYTSK